MARMYIEQSRFTYGEWQQSVCLSDPCYPCHPWCLPGFSMDTYLVAYDISNPKRLRKVAQTCEDFGFRRQYSVFLCRLGATDIVRLKSRLYDIIDLQKDQVLFIPMCGRCASDIEALGRPVEKHDARDVVIVT